MKGRSVARSGSVDDRVHARLRRVADATSDRDFLDDVTSAAFAAQEVSDLPEPAAPEPPDPRIAERERRLAEHHQTLSRLDDTERELVTSVFFDNRFLGHPDPPAGYAEVHEPRRWSQSRSRTNATVYHRAIGCRCHDHLRRDATSVKASIDELARSDSSRLADCVGEDDRETFEWASVHGTQVEGFDAAMRVYDRVGQHQPPDPDDYITMMTSTFEHAHLPAMQRLGWMQRDRSHEAGHDQGVQFAQRLARELRAHLPAEHGEPTREGKQRVEDIDSMTSAIEDCVPIDQIPATVAKQQAGWFSSRKRIEDRCQALLDQAVIDTSRSKYPRSQIREQSLEWIPKLSRLSKLELMVGGAYPNRQDGSIARGPGSLPYTYRELLVDPLPTD